MFASNKVVKSNKPNRQYNDLYGERLEKDLELTQRKKLGRKNKSALREVVED